MKQLIFGPWGPDYRDKLLDRCIEFLQQGAFDSFLYIVPTAGLAADVRQRMMMQVPGWLGKPVLTFDDLIDRIIAAASVHTQRIDSVTQERILHHLMLRSDQAWSGKPMREWASYPGVVTSLLQTISELRRANATADMLVTVQDENTEQLVSLWQAYESWLRQTKPRSLDVEEGFILANEILASHGLVKIFPNLKYVVFDHFLDFTPLQTGILQHVQSVEDLKIYVPYAAKQSSAYPELKAVMKNLQHRVFQGTDTRILDVGLEEEQGQTFPNPSVAIENIKLQSVQSVEKQWVCAAKQIKQLVNSGTSIDQIALLVPDVKTHIQEIDRLLRIEGIPHRAAVHQSLLTVPIIQDIVTILRLVTYQWERKDLLALAIRWDLMYQRLPIATLERLTRKLGIQRGESVWFSRFEDLVRNASDPSEQDNLLEDVQTLKQWFESIRCLLSSIPKKGRLVDFVGGFRELIRSLGIKERLVQVGDAFVADVSTLSSPYTADQLRRDMRAVQLVEDWLRDIQKIEQKLSNDQVVYTIQDVLELLLNDWEAIEVPTKDMQDAGVWILEPSTVRGLTFSHVFFTNLNEGSFPKSVPVQWLLGEEERKQLVQNGVSIAAKQLQVELQKAFFAMSLTLATDSIFFLYIEETGRLRSRFLDTLVREFPALLDSQDHVSNYDPYLQGTAIVPNKREQISNHKELRLWNAIQLGRSISKSMEPQTDWVATIERESRESQIWSYVMEATSVEQQRTQSGYGTYEGVLRDSNILQNLEAQFHFDRTYSASFFNQYGECPFKFFLGRVIQVRLSEEEGDEVSPLDRGNLYHAVLFRLYSEWQATQDKKLSIHDQDRWLQDLRRIFDEETKRYETITYIHTNVTWNVEKEHIWNHLQNWLKYDLMHLTSMDAKLVPHRLEWSFGMQVKPDVPSDPHSIEEPVEVAGLRFQGRIDRIDYSAEDGLYTVYDYKTTGSSLQGKKDVQTGIDFQLPIYLQVVSKQKQHIAMEASANGAGAMYYGIEKLNRGKGLLHESYKDQIALKRQAHVKTDEWDDLLGHSEKLLQSYHRNMREGQFPLQPRKCSDSCPYKHVCRYDEIAALSKEPVQQGKGGEAGE